MWSVKVERREAVYSIGFDVFVFGMYTDATNRFLPDEVGECTHIQVMPLWVGRRDCEQGEIGKLGSACRYNARVSR